VRGVRQFVLLVFAAGALGRAQTTALDRFVGRDLWKEHLSETEQRLLDNVIGAVPKGNIFEPDPWHVWTTNRVGQTRYVVLLGQPEISVPGGSSACVQLFDATAKRIGSWSFQTGWRITLDSASFELSSDLANDMIVLHMSRFINGRNVAKEYYAINNDRLQFVRMESDKGEAVQNEYVYPNFEIGIVPDAHTADQWAGMLESNDNSDVLSALVFLGGRHLTEPQRRFPNEPQESKDAELFQRLMASARIQGLIDRLSGSPNEWVRQAALLAARGPRERLLQ